MHLAEPAVGVMPPTFVEIRLCLAKCRAEPPFRTGPPWTRSSPYGCNVVQPPKADGPLRVEWSRHHAAELQCRATAQGRRAVDRDSGGPALQMLSTAQRYVALTVRERYFGSIEIPRPRLNHRARSGCLRLRAKNGLCYALAARSVMLSSQNNESDRCIP